VWTDGQYRHTDRLKRISPSLSVVDKFWKCSQTRNDFIRDIDYVENKAIQRKARTLSASYNMVYSGLYESNEYNTL